MDKKFTTILIGYDNSPSAVVALKKGAELASKAAASLHLVYVDHSGHFPDPESAEAHANAELSGMGVSFSFHVKVGRPYAEIVAVAKQVGADLILMGAHGHHGFMANFIGSTALRVVGMSKCPVIIIPESASAGNFKELLVPFDNTPETRQKWTYAAAVAGLFNSNCHILGVTHDKDQEAASHVNIYANQAADYFNARKVNWTLEINTGVKVAQTCIDKAKEKGAGLIFMMNETEGAGLFLDRIAQHIVNNSPVPVMAIPNQHVEGAGGSGY